MKEEWSLFGNREKGMIIDTMFDIAFIALCGAIALTAGWFAILMLYK